MMTKLREMTFIFIWILVFAFVGLMVFEWGMDFTGLKRQTNVVGKIDGQKITIQEFQQAVQNVYLQERENSGNEPDEARMQQIRDQVWDQMVQRVLFAKQIRKRDIKITDKEVYLYITQQPQSLPPVISQNPNFMTDGKFDMAKYQQALNNPQIDWTPIEQYVREVLPFQKLQTIITASVLVTEEEVKADYLDKNQKSKIEYLLVPTTAFIKDSVKASESDTRQYYEKNKEEFKRDERRRLNYVLFPTNPTASDSQKVLDLADEIKSEAQSGEDFATLADEYSEDPSVRTNHGDLGYFERDRMVKEFSEAAFSGKPGEIVGPVITSFGVHIIKVIDKKKEQGQEMVHAAHILLKFEPSALTLETAQNLANNFMETAKEEGFKTAADNYKYDVKETPEFTDNNYIPGFGQMRGAVEWTFRESQGDISPVHKTAQGYVIFEIAEVLPAGYRPLDEVKQLCKSRVEQEKRKELALNYAQIIQEKINQNESFTRIAAGDDSRQVMFDSTAQFTRSQPSPKIGRAPEVIAASFTLPPGEVSSMLDTDRGYFFVKVLDRTPFKEEDYKAQREAIRTRLLNQKSQLFFSKWYESLKEKASIQDNRYLFFAT
jgi:peptidyl-prolyl cis-trans isomerase D